MIRLYAYMCWRVARHPADLGWRSRFRVMRSLFPMARVFVAARKLPPEYHAEFLESGLRFWENEMQARRGGA